ncbi:MAG: hypothetical protein WBA74_13520, partial [Cyclobacteriaceae bacterium]
MRSLILYSVLALLLFNCKGLKKLPEGEKLYTGAKIKVNTQKPDRAARIREKLVTIPEPKPNVKFLGMRPFLWLHNQIKEPDKEKGFKYWLKYKIGKPPILLSMVEPERVANQLGNALYNDGYFKNKVDYDIRTKEKSKTASVLYTTQPNVQFTIKEISYPKDSIDIEHLEEIRKGSLLKTGQNYSLERIEKERLRIEQVLKDSGYYYFDHSFIIFLADSTVGNHEVELIATMAKQTPQKAKIKYKIDEITMLVSSGLLNQNDSLNKTQTTEPVTVDGITYYDAENRYKPKALVRFVEVEEGQVYHKINYQQTVRQLFSLQNFNYVDMNFPESEKEGYLNAKLNLITKPMKSIRLEIQATSESNNFVGSSITTTFLNRNFFRGAEIFNLSLTTGFETQISGQQQNALNSYEVSLRSSVKIPRLISPFGFREVKNKYVPHTTIGLGLETIRRTNFYSFNSAEINFGYEWIQSETVRHELFPVVLKLTQLTSVSDDFREILDQNPLLRESYEEQFIVGSKYNFIINTRSLEGNVNKTNNFFFDFS